MATVAVKCVQETVRFSTRDVALPMATVQAGVKMDIAGRNAI